MSSHLFLFARFALLASVLSFGMVSTVVAEDCNWNWIEDDEDIAQGTSEDCNGNAVPDECDTSPEPFNSTSGWLMPVGGTSPKSYTIPSARAAAGDVTLSLAISADMASADETIAVSLRGFGPIGTVVGSGSACPLIPAVTEIVVSRWSYNYAISTGQVIFDLVPSESVDATACGGNSYMSASISYDVAALPDCNENGMLDECDIAQGTSADVNTNGQPDECESVQGSCIIFRTVPVPPYAGGTPYPVGTVVDQANETITFPPGGPYRVWLELRISNWACTGGAMGTWQGQYYPLPSGVVYPPQPCDSTADCDDAGFGPGRATGCGLTQPGICNAVFEQQPPQQPTALGFDIEACMPTNLACGGTQVTTPPVVDDGAQHYAMTLVVETAPDFTGSATITVQNPGADTFFQDETGAQVPIGQAIPATIIVEPLPCCRPNGTCAPALISECGTIGGTLVDECLGDCDGNLLDDVCEFTDCNGNDRHDACDIVGGFATDCDFNDIPDECELTDCTGNSIHDACDFAAGDAFDCNANRIPDDCDIAGPVSEDADGDGVPDECEGLPMSRYLAFVPEDVIAGATNHAARITLVSLPRFPAFNGEHRWLGAPALFPDGASPALEIYKFPASRVECDPVLADWTAYPRYFAYGSAVVPDSQYEIRFGDEACVMSGKESCLSAPILVNTGKWGDIIVPFGGMSQPNFSDVSAEVDKFRQIVGAPIKPRSQLRNNETNPAVRVDFSDISLCVNAFQGFVYPYSGPGACAAERQSNR